LQVPKFLYHCTINVIVILCYMNILRDFFHLLFPVTCAVCGDILLNREYSVCTRCLYHLPKSYYSQDGDNPVARLFWGREYGEHATAFLLFNKGSKTQKLVHALKYKDNRQVGYDLGVFFGRDRKSGPFSAVDMIMPVPLHRRKAAKRGFNQSEQIARGIADALEKPCATDILIKHTHTATQTRKSRYARWLNVETVFAVKNADVLHNKHILLVDDVITTGATCEACCAILRQDPTVKVSIAALAHAVY
jgi:competence protein ComFC